MSQKHDPNGTRITVTLTGEQYEALKAISQGLDGLMNLSDLVRLSVAKSLKDGMFDRCVDGFSDLRGLNGA